MRATGFARRFYASALETEWRFGESEAYLQELGALDDTSAWYGKEVIIPNYIQGTSNCIVATSHYHVCCLNICEEILQEIEDGYVERSLLVERFMVCYDFLVTIRHCEDVSLGIVWKEMGTSRLA